MQHQGDILNDQPYVKFLNAVEQEGTNPDTMQWRLLCPFCETKVPANPLLYKSGSETARETETETEEPKNVYLNRITSRLERVNRGSGEVITI